MTWLARIRIVLLTVFVIALSACYEFPPPQVVKQADPSPMKGAKSFVVAPVTYVGFTYSGQSEEAWLATRDAKQVESWKQDKAGMTEKLLKKLNSEKQDEQSFRTGAQAGDGEFLIAVNIDDYDGQMRWTAEIRDSGGQVVDIVKDPHAVTASFNTWMAEESGAQICAHMLSKYLHSRAFPESH